MTKNKVAYAHSSLILNIKSQICKLLCTSCYGPAYSNYLIDFWSPCSSLKSSNFVVTHQIYINSTNFPLHITLNMISFRLNFAERWRNNSFDGVLAYTGLIQLLKSSIFRIQFV